jgi:hypothetical protein
MMEPYNQDDLANLRLELANHAATVGVEHVEDIAVPRAFQMVPRLLAERVQEIFENRRPDSLSSATDRRYLRAIIAAEVGELLFKLAYAARKTAGKSDNGIEHG